MADSLDDSSERPSGEKRKLTSPQKEGLNVSDDLECDDTSRKKAKIETVAEVAEDPTIKQVKDVDVNKQRGKELHQRLQKYVLSAYQLQQNGFPDFIPGTQKVKMKKHANAEKTYCADPNYRVCYRCSTRFALSDNGKSECRFHWGKTFVWNRMSQPYTCCGQRPGATQGCDRAKCHVYRDNEYNDVSGYVRTLPADALDDEDDAGVYALDCEMVFTTAGSEMAKVTVLDHNLDVVLEKVVKPSTPVIDYHTRFSGLTEQDMKGVTTSLKDVHDILLRIFTKKTILVGHSLDHDLIALKLVHPTVVDTSVVFPHNRGPPLKKALKTICSDFLGKEIQVNHGAGHDSREDASACMELMLWKTNMEK